MNRVSVNPSLPLSVAQTAAAEAGLSPWLRLKTAPWPPSLNVVRAGTSGPTLVFLPGLGGTTRYYENYLGSLPQSHRVLIVDPLGFGDSPKSWRRYTIDRHVEALYATLKGEGTFTLVGHSMGTLLAVAFAARHPEQVERLVLLSLPYFDGKDKAIQHFRAGPPVNWFLTNMTLAAVICILSRRVFAWLMPYLQPDLPREVAADIVKHSWRSFTSSLWEVIYHYDVARDADVLGEHLPVLCLHGDRDATAPLGGILELAQGRPNWKVSVLPGVDHHPLFRVPKICLQAFALGMAPEALPVGRDSAHPSPG